MKKSWQHKLATRPIPEDVREDLLFWKDTLSSFKHLRLITHPEPIDISWVGDASTSFGIGVLVGRRWSQFSTTTAWGKADDDHKHINFLETAAIRIGLLMVIEINRMPGRNLVVWTDNTTAQAAVTNRKSKNKAVNEEWKSIQRLLIQNQLDIHAKRVTSKDNTADELSRGLRGVCKEGDRLEITLPPDLERYLCRSS